ncbi:MAG: murein DD-endopeptidase MepM/ murein hydrolase activator NlpD [Candidatus Endobugula sp.]|jgi:murein DD-endopeptidase MepM/ murein hydrolase activator NlpD
MVNIMCFFKFGILLLILLYPSAYAGELYKYKDDNGKWVFTDKKPMTTQKVDKIQYDGSKKGPLKPKVYVENTKGGYALVFYNPYYAPIEVEVYSSFFQGGSYRETVAEFTTKTLYESTDKISRFRYKWQIGDPEASEDTYLYKFPASSKQAHTITQSFNGSFSHSKRPSIHAVDIAMSVGTYISAAREGTVIWVKDDYHMGGSNKYFLDKANYVKVLHSDGTYAVYAHILLGSLLVEPGDKVMAGDRLARAGSSGYSTGPHLHFVIWKNVGLKTVSVPFKFINNTGQSFSPRRGMKVDGIEKSF